MKPSDMLRAIGNIQARTILECAEEMPKPSRKPRWLPGVLSAASVVLLLAGTLLWRFNSPQEYVPDGTQASPVPLAGPSTTSAPASWVTTTKRFPNASDVFQDGMYFFPMSILLPEDGPLFLGISDLGPIPEEGQDSPDVTVSWNYCVLSMDTPGIIPSFSPLDQRDGRLILLNGAAGSEVSLLLVISSPGYQPVPFQYRVSLFRPLQVPYRTAPGDVNAPGETGSVLDVSQLFPTGSALTSADYEANGIAQLIGKPVWHSTIPGEPPEDVIEFELATLSSPTLFQEDDGVLPEDWFTLTEARLTYTQLTISFTLSGDLTGPFQCTLTDLEGNSTGHSIGFTYDSEESAHWELTGLGFSTEPNAPIKGVLYREGEPDEAVLEFVLVPKAEATEKEVILDGVYATRYGTHFHRIPDCSGMRNAQQVSRAQAIYEWEKTPCPVCNP